MACSSCVHRNLTCSRVPSKTAISPLSAKSPSLLNQDDIPKDVAETLTELYLRYMHDKPHALFHEPSLREAVANGSVAPVVLLSILGLAARYGIYSLALVF